MNIKGITRENIVGIAILILALTNAIMQMFGYNPLPISDELVSEIISTLFLIVTALYNTYKNRNITSASQKAQEITDLIKNGQILIEDVQYLIDNSKEER